MRLTTLLSRADCGAINNTATDRICSLQRDPTGVMIGNRGVIVL